MLHAEIANDYYAGTYDQIDIAVWGARRWTRFKFLENQGPGFKATVPINVSEVFKTSIIERADIEGVTFYDFFPSGRAWGGYGMQFDAWELKGRLAAAAAAARTRET